MSPQEIMDNVKKGYYEQSDNGVAQFKTDVLEVYGFESEERFHYFMEKSEHWAEKFEWNTKTKYEYVMGFMPEEVKLRLPLHQVRIMYSILSQTWLFRKQYPLETDKVSDQEQLKELCDEIHKVLQIY